MFSSNPSALTVLLLIFNSVRSEVCQCGQKNEKPLLDTRVVGGGDALSKEFPWAAHITIRSGGKLFRCGGSLISDRFVITAAHCLKERMLSINVTLGDHNIKVKEGFEYRTRVKEFGFDIHNSYSNQPELGTIEFDIALLELEKPVNFREYKYIRPICLPSSDYVDYKNNVQIGTVTGWGVTAVDFIKNSKTGVISGIADKSSASDVLQKLEDVELMDQKECDESLIEYEKATGRKAKLRRSNLCGVSDTGDSCLGDSGSGLVGWNKDKKAYELIGVVSFGVVGCEKLPGVYTRVSEAVDWVKGKSRGGLTCSGPGPTPDPKPAPPVTGWTQWSEFTECEGRGKIGKKERNRRCRDGTGKSCKRLIETQERRCFL